MTENILGRPLAEFNSLYRSKIASEEGHALAEFIAEHKGLVQLATRNGRPAIAPLFSLLTPELSDCLHGEDHLLRTFGYLVGVQMANDGYMFDVEDQNQRRTVNWPYSLKVSECQIYHRAE